MLQKEAVVPEMINLIKELQGNSLFKDHVLVGGTALALQLGHRTSTDIDLFSSQIQDANELNEWLVGGIKMLRHDIEPNDVPEFIEQAIEDYNKNINIGN